MLLVGWVGAPSGAFAHREDEYVQATLVVIEPNGVRLQINLNPGIAVAEQVVAAVDRNGDGAISPHEASNYADWLERDLALRIDRQTLQLKVTRSEFESPEELRTGSGLIQVEFFATFGPLAAGSHTLTLENRHMTSLSVYLINAAKPKFAAVQITSQKRNQIQSTGEIQFTFAPSRPRVTETAGQP